MSSTADDGLRVIARDSEPVPFGYTVSETGVLTITNAHAEFDGTNASGAFLPCLAIYQQNGVLLGRFFPDGGSVNAGSSADVSYAPFLGGGGGGSSSGVGVEHNDSLIATEPNIDFEDTASVTWSITDDAANSRVKLAATAAGGGSSTDFGPSTWEVPIWNLHGAADILASSGVDWVYDTAPSSGGYATRATPAQDAFFAVLVALHPEASIWGFTFTYYGGSDYGVIAVDIASLLYQSALRSSGNDAGKIQDVFRSGTDILANYGSDPTFLNLATLDAYNATPFGESNYPGTLTFIPGGAEGAALTNLSVSTDPYTGLSISDGGPGWYVIRFQVRTKNASSSNYRFRIPRVSVLRVPDGGGF